MQILIVVVRYKMSLDASPTMRSLTSVLARRPDLLRSMQLLVWDNSKDALENPSAPVPMVYRHAATNVGVSGAYNGALLLAEEAQIPWLLLLDQDTEISELYLDRMLTYSESLSADKTIATVVPFVRASGTLVSPRRIGKLLRNFAIARDVSGPYPAAAYAVNSGTLMRTSALRDVGGFSDRYWLDLSDAYIFHVLYLAGKRIYIAGDLELNHSIASLNFDRDMSPARYANFLAAENSFADEFQTGWRNLLYTFWLVARTARQYRRYRNKAFARLSLQAMLQRIFLRRETRLRRWSAELNRRNLPAIENGQQVG